MYVVELLDHQKALALQNVPPNALYLLKKTGIVDEYIGADDIYDNHFLYVQVRTWSDSILLFKCGCT